MKIGSRGDGGDAFAPVVAGELDATSAAAAARTQLVPAVWEIERKSRAIAMFSETRRRRTLQTNMQSLLQEKKKLKKERMRKRHEYEW